MARKQFEDNRMNRVPKAKSGLIPAGSGASGLIPEHQVGDATGVIEERSTDKTAPSSLKGWSSDKPSTVEMPGYALARAARN
jgi:hypothetical protein